MKRLIFSLTLAVSCIAASAQQYIVVNGEPPILASDVEKITYEVDDQFDQILLPGALTLDPKTTIFSAALQLTGLADTLKTYLYAHPDPSDESYSVFRSSSLGRKAWPFYRRLNPHDAVLLCYVGPDAHAVKRLVRVNVPLRRSRYRPHVIR